MRRINIILLLLFPAMSAFAFPDEKKLISELNQELKQVEQYDDRKLNRISVLRRQLQQTPVSDFKVRYNLALKLYEEYKSYNYDSSMQYARQLQELAKSQNEPSLIIDAKLKVAFILLSGGMFKETFDSLKVISPGQAPNPIKGEYYTLLGRAYYNLADFYSDSSHSPFYNSRANLYLDSAVRLFAPNSFEKLYYSAIIFLKTGHADSALANLTKLIDSKGLSYHQLALATSTLGGIYLSQGKEAEAKPYLVQAAIADIKSSTKETLALLNLASIVYKEGNLEHALTYIEKANADATFYNARLRKVQIGAILPLIEGEMISTIKSQKQTLQVFIVILSILVVSLTVLALIVKKQVQKLKAAREDLFQANLKQQQVNQELSEANELKEKYNFQLAETNRQLIELNQVKEKYNSELQLINSKLAEANKIKEEYIGYYFSMDTEFMGRIVKLVNSVQKKLVERKWEEIRLLLKNVDVQKEKEELLKNFDKVFVKLFPNFVMQFNSLFKEEDRIVLKEDQLLNTELRIFALIRLGITDNEKIAEILDYSINTIYAKKTKVRSKTIVNKDEFERKIMEITTLGY